MTINFRVNKITKPGQQETRAIRCESDDNTPSFYRRNSRIYFYTHYYYTHSKIYSNYTLLLFKIFPLRSYLYYTSAITVLVVKQFTLFSEI